MSYKVVGDIGGETDLQIFQVYLKVKNIKFKRIHKWFVIKQI